CGCFMNLVSIFDQSGGTSSFDLRRFKVQEILDGRPCRIAIRSRSAERSQHNHDVLVPIGVTCHSHVEAPIMERESQTSYQTPPRLPSVTLYMTVHCWRNSM